MAIRTITSAIFRKPSNPRPLVSANPTLRIWEDDKDDHTTHQELKLSHPILRHLESSCHTLQKFHQIQAQLILNGLFHHPLSAGRVIKKLCSSPFSSNLDSALSIFSRIDQPDAFTCNTIIKSFVNLNSPDKALRIYEQMLSKQIPFNHYTFPLLAKACAELVSMREGERTIAQTIKHGFEHDLFVHNSLIHMYFTFESVDSARQLFDEMLVEPDVVTWNSMIDGYSGNGEIEAARQVFEEMPVRNVVTWNSMIAGYVRGNDMDTAHELFTMMPLRDTVSWNSMIDGYTKIGNVSLARKLFDKMPRRNVVSWNMVLALYVRNKNYVESLKLFDEMIDVGEVEPNEATFVSILTACANLGVLDRGKWVHSYIISNNDIKPDVLLSTSLLTMYAKCGRMDLAKGVFDQMPERNVVSWNSMIMGYALHGHGDKALEMFLEMEKIGLRPNDITFICVLCACTHGGLVLQGCKYFDLMIRKYQIKPKTEHYGCMVDLLGRAGFVGDSEEMIKNMPMDPAPTVWGALLAACRIHGNYELGEIVGKHLMELEPSNAGPYVLLSNIYAASGRWDDVERVRGMMKEKGVEKVVGFSLINQNVYDIEDSVGGDLIHKKNMVYSVLGKMDTQISRHTEIANQL